MFNILALAFSLSIDALGIGTSYGIRKIKIPIYATVIIAALAFLFTSVSIFFGTILLHFLPPSIAKLIGIFILILMGIWIIYQGLHDKKEVKDTSKKDETIFNMIIKSLGITIKIIRTPEYCDMDKSSSIEPIEALYLGVALSVDSIGAGIGTAVLGLNTIAIPICVAVFQILFLHIGLTIGKKLRIFNGESNIWVILSGSILILVGIIRLFIS